MQKTASLVWVLLPVVLVSVEGQTPRSVPTPPRSFEVASVKLLRADSFAARIEITGNRVTASGPLVHILSLAFDVKAYQVFDVPKWAQMGGDLYQIDARAAEGRVLSMPEARQALQSLLSQRFQLVVHRETREIPVYALVTGRGGPRMKESAPDSKFDLTITPGAVWHMTLLDAPMASFCTQLSFAINDRPILDRTGLTKLYDFTLEWAPDNAPPDDARSASSIFTAVQEQLGLRLESRREPSEVLVIDRVERPSEN